jgi:hypothetical protein
LANPGLATKVTHGMAAGTIGYWTVASGMIELDGWASSVKAGTADNWTLERINTTSMSVWISDAGNTFTPVATWLTLSPATSYAIGGGEADEQDVSRLIDSTRQIEYGLLSAETVTFENLSDSQLAGMIAVDAAARAGTSMTFRITLSNTERRVFRGVVTVPSETQGLSVVATGGFKVAVKGQVLRLPVAS